MNKIKFKLMLLFVAISISVFAFNESNVSNESITFDYVLAENCNSYTLYTVPYSISLTRTYKGKTYKEWGVIFDWGKREDGARQRRSNVNSSYIGELKRKGVLEEDVEWWKKLYKDAVDDSEGAETAVERLNLMNEILKWY